VISNAEQHTPKPGTLPASFEWIDAIKGIAIAWIVAYHIALVVYGIPPFDHPKNNWPELGARLAQMRPLPGSDLAGAANNAARYISWLGYQGVHLFLIVSGFALAWSLVRRSLTASVELTDFMRRRFWRIFPEYWAAHLFFLICFILFGSPWMAPFSRQMAMSLLGLRFTADTFSYIATAWWYIGLIVQLYLVFPLLWLWLRRKGTAHFLAGAALITLTSRYVTLVLVGAQIELWSMGLLFTNRLFEFALGMGLAHWLARNPSGLDRIACRGWPLAAALAIYALGLALSFTLLGAVAAPILIAAGLFPLTYALARYGLPRVRPLARLAIWLGSYSYTIYLLHHPIINSVVPKLPTSPALFVPLLAALLALLALLSLAFHTMVERASAAIQHWLRARTAVPSIRLLRR
jgi:peptidoglycan/LPS O-acetylase OafA/YrhL